MFSDLKGLVSNLAVVTTILQFCSGMLVCKQYIKNGSTAEASPLPFFCGLFSSGLWLLYGLTKSDDKIVLVNIIGILLMVPYLAVFYALTIKKSSFIKQTLSTVIFSVSVFGYFLFENDNELLLNYLGTFACLSTLFTIATPMSKLLYVIRVKNTQCLPFPMILMSFFVSALWFMYGLLDEDAYLAVPNFIGILLALFQLLLFVIYPSNQQVSSLGKSLIA